MDELLPAIRGLETMPSMRALMTAGEALARENLAGYNCAYLAINHKRKFAEALYVLMCGTGVGFSCERQEIHQLPTIPDTLVDCDDIVVVGDSKEGWAKAFRKLVSCLYEGDIPKIDYGNVRPAGARLRVFGGRASGPEPLKKLFRYVVASFQKARGRKLNSLEVHDIMCVIGEIVVVGGVRRSALISLSNLSDRRMQEAKTGDWRMTQSQRELANNSVAYTEKPEVEIFMEEWLSLVKSKSGERGIFNRVAAQKQAARWGRRSKDKHYGVNPCGEILLRDAQLCNLTEVVVRADDTLQSLRKKVRLATIMGTFQSTLTSFGFVGDTWVKNTAEERLLGVSLTGIYDNETMSGKHGLVVLKGWLNELRDYAREVNKEWAEKLGIPPSAAITCVKPSGTVSQLTDAASGIHPRYSQFYLRTIRLDKKDALYAFMKDSGVYCEDERSRPESTAVFYFPTAAPKGAVTRHDVSALDHLRLWSVYQYEWCEHNPSITVDVEEKDWFKVGAWVYENFDAVCGVTFMPRTDHVYEQAPYIEMTEKEYDEWLVKYPMPTINWADLGAYEDDDNTTSAQTLACTGNVCDMVGVAPAKSM
jgi:ribonucleoside-diphosphate reductase alpha chain